MKSRIDTLMLWSLWNSGTDHDTICDTLSISHCRLRQLARRFNLRGHERLGRIRLHASDGDPSPSEIEERAARIRSKWTPEETERRSFGVRHAKVLAYKLNRDLTFSGLDE
jgi:hypothetical protein